MTNEQYQIVNTLRPPEILFREIIKDSSLSFRIKIFKDCG